jgi:uncharacterized protein (TIGR02391 family)
MASDFQLFEKITRKTQNLGSSEVAKTQQTHAFDERNIHPAITKVSQKLFDDGHYSQATFEALKYLDIEVKTISGINDSGLKLMMSAFNDASPKIKLTAMSDASEIDEQSGFRFIFSGVMSAIRNPRGHAIKTDTIETCLDHLSITSALLRRLENRESP